MTKYSCCKYTQNWKWKIVNNYKRYKERTEQLKKCGILCIYRIIQFMSFCKKTEYTEIVL